MRTACVCLLVVLAAPVVAEAQSAEEVQSALSAEAKVLVAWAADPVVVQAVQRQNARHTAMAEVKRIDGEWIAGRADSVVREVTTGTCADRLRELASVNARYGETFIADANGALVCATRRTTDYWQGDEAKWTRAFNDGAGAVFIDRQKLDDSAAARLAQISLPILEKGKAIGVLTVGIHVDRLD